MNLHPIDTVSLWVVLAVTASLLFLSVELGFLVGRKRGRRSDDSKKFLSGTIMGATLGLLAFMMAFTFGQADELYNARKKLVLEEANAIGTTYLRAQLLQEPPRSEIRRLLREYVDVRLKGGHWKTGSDLVAASDRSEALHKKLWEQTLRLTDGGTGTIFEGLFVDSLNQVIDLHMARLTAGIRNRIPASIMITLCFVAIIAMAMMGYQAGASGSRNHLAMLAVVLAFSSILLLIAELDRPGKTLVTVSQEAMIDLQSSMKE